MKPVLQALLLSDRVYQDKDSGKKIIAGVFNSVFFRKLDRRTSTPTEVVQSSIGAAGSPWAYISLTDIRGNAKFELRYVDLSTNEVLLELEFELECDDPLQTIELVLPVPRLPHPHEGVYAFELIFGGEQLGFLRITAQEIKKPEEASEE